jgi:hypothetical protein
METSRTGAKPIRDAIVGGPWRWSGFSDTDVSSIAHQNAESLYPALAARSSSTSETTIRSVPENILRMAMRSITAISAAASGGSGTDTWTPRFWRLADAVIQGRLIEKIWTFGKSRTVFQKQSPVERPSDCLLKRLLALLSSVAETHVHIRTICDALKRRSGKVSFSASSVKFPITSFCVNYNANFGACDQAHTKGDTAGETTKGALVQFPIARQGLV